MNMKKIEAMVSQSRRDRTKAPHAQGCIDAEILVLAEQIRSLEKQVRTLEMLRRKAVTRIPMLLKPLVPPSDKHEAVAVFDGDGFNLYWEKEDQDLVEFAEWPLDQDYVFNSDLEALGFRVEHA